MDAELERRPNEFKQADKSMICGAFTAADYRLPAVCKECLEKRSGDGGGAAKKGRKQSGRAKSSKKKGRSAAGR